MFLDKGVIYGIEETNDVNKVVQEKISSHLFLTCNYAPSPYMIYGEDAKFVVGILNLYKYTIDGSIIDKIPSMILIDMEGAFNKKEFGEKINLVKALRTMYCHNESDISGNDDDVKRVDAWTGKRPQSVEDYIDLNRKLQTLASEIDDLIYKFVEAGSKCKQKTVLVSKWEETIASFYRRPSTRNILQGQLKKFYSARFNIQDIDSGLNYKVAMCVKQYYIGELEVELEKARERCKILSAQSRRIVQPIVDAAETKLLKRKSEILKRLGKSEKGMADLDKKPYMYLEYYLNELPQRIIDFMNSTADTNVYGTLLPQDIVQYIVKQDFDMIMRK